ncbi:neuronal acetylcholine receptor subunit alpha-6-like [Pecten maximus]|uniref:neuronal acetylcholine receptor subunit alpha-6-like n=1 Tax=Pecten maximus TaxID=6579 RepID=UPI0014586868|nr:neuronal acetylcholine receptor subunit alpha-6-like [Pecten maximus]
MYFCILVVIALYSPRLVMGNNSSVDTQLYKDLLLNYEKNVRPGINYSYPTMVECEFTLAGLNRFKEIDSKISILGVFAIQWFDERLSWNPYEYGGILSTLVPENLLWKPDIAITNSHSGIRFLYGGGFHIRVLYDGTITLTTGDTYDLYCTADVTYYPVDTQTCYMAMVLWNSYPWEVTFDHVDVYKNMDNFTSTNPSWDVTETTMYTTVDQTLALTILNIRIRLKRLSEYVVINMILPVCFLCVINIFVFFLPAESGERIGFSITLLLSVAVFMTILSDSLPQSSRPQIAVLCYFLFSQLMVSILMMVFTIFGLRFYWMSPERPIPVYLKRFSQTMGWLVGCQCFKRRKIIDVEEPERIPDSGKDEYNIKSVAELDETPHEADEHTTWHKIASDFDNFCIIFFILLIFLTNAVFCGRLLNPQL